jgi:putative transposase
LQAQPIKLAIRCNQSGIELVEGHAMPDHMHLCVSVPPKFSVANAVGRLKGKSAIRIHQEYLGRKRNFTGFHSWAKGYCVSTVGLDEAVIRNYIRTQEEREKKDEQLSRGRSSETVKLVELAPEKAAAVREQRAPHGL